jgi:uncharacterized protein (TIGR03083 family)
MPDRQLITSNLLHQYDSVDELVGGLSGPDWSIRSLCPDWDVRGVITHLGAVEHLLTGWNPEAADTPIPFGRAKAFMGEAAELDTAALVARYRSVIDERRRELAALTDEDLARPCLTPVGPGTYERFLRIRVFDYWVHERDLRLPLDRPTDDGGPAAEMALDEVHGSLGYIVGKKVGLPTGNGITFHLTGPVVRDLHARVEDRAAVVDELADPDVEVTVDSTTFIMLACGRLDPQTVIDRGAISWTGEPGSPAAKLGEQAARNLRFTM